LLGYFKRGYISDFDLKVENIPGAFIIQREIKKAVDGRPFFYNCPETRKPIYCEAVAADEFFYYYKLWENFYYFGLPLNRGWASEREWLIEFLKVFIKTHKAVENFLEIKRG